MKVIQSTLKQLKKEAVEEKTLFEDEEFEKTKAMLKLMCELNAGKTAGEEEGYVSSSDVRAYFRNKKNEI